MTLRLPAFWDGSVSLAVYLCISSHETDPHPEPISLADKGAGFMY